MSLGERQSVGKVPYIVNWMAANKHFVINMILFITVFAQCSNKGSAHYFYIYINVLGKSHKLVIYPKYVLKQFWRNVIVLQLALLAVTTCPALG